MTDATRSPLLGSANHGAAPAFELLPRAPAGAPLAQDAMLALRLCVPLPLPAKARFSGDPAALAVAVALAFSCTALADWTAMREVRGVDALAFNAWGLYASVTWVFAAAALLFLLAMANGRLHRLCELLTGVLLVETARTVATPIADAVAHGVFDEHDGIVDYPGSFGMAAGELAATAIGLYCTAVMARVVYLALDVAAPRRFAATGAAAAVLWATGAVLPQTGLFRQAPGARQPPLNVETTYLKQPQLVQASLDDVRQSRPGVVDTYFVGFAPYAGQDVFANEVRHVEALFRAKLDAEGRTVLLVNSRATLDSRPLANGHNLAAVLHGIGRKMESEDLLFLHMTSHGSAEHQFSVSFANLGLNDLSAEEVGRIVDEADLPWRVVVVSACYSGGYIEALKSPNTLVMTAADAQSASFGCEHGREYTYFGEALYQDNLADRDFVAAFHRAAQAVGEREEREGLTPSAPQIWVGDAIAEKLKSG